MTTKQYAYQPVTLIQLVSVLTPIVIVLLAWGVNVSVRIRALEIQSDNMIAESNQMKQTLCEINKHLGSIAISINTLTVKWEENEKKNTGEFEKYPIRL